MITAGDNITRSDELFAQLRNDSQEFDSSSNGVSVVNSTSF